MHAYACSQNTNTTHTRCKRCILCRGGLRLYLVQRSLVNNQQKAIDYCNVDRDDDFPGRPREIIEHPVDMSERRPDQRDNQHAEPQDEAFYTYFPLQDQLPPCHVGDRCEIAGWTLARWDYSGTGFLSASGSVPILSGWFSFAEVRGVEH